MTLTQLYLKAYRLVGFLVITTSLTFLFGYGIIMLFFMINNTWIAPTIVSQTSDKMLQFAAGYQQNFQNIETLKVAVSQAKRDVVYAENNAIMLHKLGDELIKYGQSVYSLGNVKSKDLTASYGLIKDLRQLKIDTETNVRAGLITKQDSTQMFSAIQQFSNTTTDGNIALNTLKITVESQLVVLNSQIMQANNDVLTKEETLAAAQRSLAVASDQMNTLTATSYYSAYRKGAYLAFVAYDNRHVAKVGEPVYDCYLMIIACHKVGTIRHVYNDEQLIDFPLFNVRLSRTVRGFFVDLDMTNAKSMDSSVMFVRKPLFL